MATRVNEGLLHDDLASRYGPGFGGGQSRYRWGAPGTSPVRSFEANAYGGPAAGVRTQTLKFQSVRANSKEIKPA